MRIALPASLILCILASACSSKRASPSFGSPSLDTGSAKTPGAALPSLTAFEGRIVATIKQSRPAESPIPIVLSVRRNKIRVDIPDQIGGRPNPLGGKSYVLFDPPAKTASIVSDAQHQALTLELAKSGEQLADLKGLALPSAPAGVSPNAPAFKLTKTGKIDTVAGYPCETWDVASDHREATVCVAEQDVPWFKIPASAVVPDRGWMADVVDGKHLPLRLVTYAKDGATEGSRIEVIQIDKMSLSPAAFEYPSSYRTIDLAPMLERLANAPSALPMQSVAPQGKAQ